MQTTFLELHDSAMNCLSKNQDIAAVSFGNNLKNLTERFLGLAKGALGSSDGAESGDEDAEGESINEEENGASRSKRRRSRDDGSPGSGGMQGGGGVGGSVPSYGGYQVSYSRENGNGRGSRSSYDNSGNQNRSAGGASGRNNTMTTNSPLSLNSRELYSFGSSEGERGGKRMQISPIGLPYSQYSHDGPLGIGAFSGLDAYSYSYHETSFSRRLHRAGLEHAHRMLTSPNADQREVARLFAYTFCYSTKEKALEVISGLLRANSKDSLDPNDYPEFSRVISKPLGYSDFAQGHGGDVPENVDPACGGTVDLSQEARTMLVKLGISLKYLGPIEVEQYIKDLGILTTTDSSVVDPDLMDVDKGPGSSQKSRTTSPVLRPKVASPSPSQRGGFTSATVMSLEYPPQDHSGYDLTRFKTTKSSTKSSTKSPTESPTKSSTKSPTEPPTKSSTKVLEGVKKYVDLDVFVKRMSFPRSSKCMFADALFRIDSVCCLSREISRVQKVGR